MQNEQRGSEKLMQGCTGITTLSEEELQQVAGGALSVEYWKVFPHGIVWPEFLQQDALKDVQQLEQAGNLLRY
ncbi:MAG: bacteriocin [Gammaproteobacteria bacterium]|nr:bacteriocin [Gammaproteobacteria bacterium]MCB1925465.1 bacteriocin [Gammaproteobacteria bacterium]